MDKGYKILPHIADAKVQAFGRTKEELFLNAMKGMSKVLRPKLKSKNEKVKSKREISVKSIDLNSLLVDFLNEILYQIQTNKEIYSEVKFSKFSDPSTGLGQVELEGELFGNKVESFGEDIKAVTYHGLKIEQNKEKSWEVTILLDI